MRILLVMSALLSLVATSVSQATPFIAFESGPVRPLVMSPDGSKLFITNIPDNRLEVFSISGGALTHTDSIPVGMEPVAVAARTNNEIWVVNQLSDSVSVIDLNATPPQVVRTLLVGDEPRDIVFAGTGANNRAFITTARRGQHRTNASISAVPGAGNPQLSVPGVGRADVWVFDAANLGSTIGGTPIEILTFFGDTPRALAVSPDNTTVYVAVFHSGNQTTVIAETSVPNGFDTASPGGGAPGGVPGPNNNANGDAAPETGLIVQFDGANWRDTIGRDWSPLVPFDLPDHDVFSINANTLASGSIQEFDHVGTVLFNMAVNPVNGKLYVTNTELPNLTRFEGPGDHGGSTVQGHLSESRVTVLDPGTLSVDPQHLNQHIDYGKLHTDSPDLVDPTQINHSLATPLQPVVSSDGSTLYIPAFGSAKIGVFATSDIEDSNFEANFDPTTESANYLSTGGGPSGLALNETDNRLYVLTRFANQVEVIDLSSGNTLETHALHNPEPQSIIDGRPFLYSALTTSGNGEASCASCHTFADKDNLAWNLGDPDLLTSTNNQPSGNIFAGQTTFHPMKGPMTTQTLRGMATHGALHWRGDRLDGFFGTDTCTEIAGAPCNEDHAFRNFTVAFEGLIGKDGNLSNPDIQKFSDFILQVLPPPNPVRRLDNSLTAVQQAASVIYHDPTNLSDGISNCVGCHKLNPAQGFFGSAGEQSTEGSFQNMKIPHVRNAYDKIGAYSLPGDQVKGFGFLHDGSVASLKNFFEIPAFNLSPSQEDAMVEFSLAFPTDLAPIVGQQVTLTASNAGVVGARISLMIQRSAASFDSLMLGGTVTECDLIVKGSVGGVERGWVRESSGLFRGDTNTTISDTALRSLATTEGPLTYTCAPPGSGTRMGIDRDEDLVLDGLDVCPAVDDPAQLNFDGDSAGDACDSDDDNDGLLDIVETNTGTFVSAVDTGSDPFSDDTDGDGFLDGAEVSQGSDPNNAASTPAAAAAPLLSLWSLVLLFGVMIGIGVWMTARGRSLPIRG